MLLSQLTPRTEITSWKSKLLRTIPTRPLRISGPFRSLHSKTFAFRHVFNYCGLFLNFVNSFLFSFQQMFKILLRTPKSNLLLIIHSLPSFFVTDHMMSLIT